MKPIIKVWCLPKMTEGELNDLHQAIVGTIVGMPALGVANENEMVCLFPSDMMSYGLGEEIVIEVTLLMRVQHTIAMRTELAKELTKTLYGMFQKSHINCFVYPFNPNDGYWSLLP